MMTSQREATMAKTIAFFSDGTGNTKDFGPDSNVELLFRRALDESGPGARQMTRYDAGVGIEFGDLVGKAFGKGISQNIKDGYDFLSEVYEPGDRIFLFGFSRGAYTARSIGGMLGRIGLPARRQTDGSDLRTDHAARKALTDRAYAIYKLSDHDERRRQSEDFRRDHAWPAHLSDEARAPWLIGVWDTVRSLGIPLGFRDFELSLFPHRFHDHELNPHVAHAYHALSIDDERLQFLPTIWNEPTAAEKLARQTGKPNPQRFEQIWFPGVHSDVGGGYANRELADVTLRWMIERAAAAGLLFAPPFDADPAQGLAESSPEGEVHDSRPDWKTKFLYPRQPRQIERGHQEPDRKEITQIIGPGRLHRSWLDRLLRWHGTDAAYRPEALTPHQDYAMALRQLSAGQRPPPGPFPNTD
jgi:uncharacterized protein (DUF2235 family)